MPTRWTLEFMLILVFEIQFIFDIKYYAYIHDICKLKL